MNRLRQVSLAAALGLSAILAIGLPIPLARGADGELFADFAADDPAPGAMTISMAPGEQSEDSFQVRILVTGVDDFYGAAFYVAYDPGVAEFTGYNSVGSFIDAEGVRVFYAAAPHAPGALDVVATRMGQEYPGVDAAGPELLLTLDFRTIALSAGSPFTFTPPREAQLCPLAGEPCSAIDDSLTWSGGTLTVVPGNRPPEIQCLSPTVDTDPGQCSALVPCDAVASCTDPDGDQTTLSCEPGSPYGVGVTSLQVTCSDGQASTTADCALTVVDNAPPELAVTMEPSLLWPPNHRMVDVKAVVLATDNCGALLVVLQSVSSNEEDDARGGGDGNTVDDIQNADVGTADFEISLRAERMGGGDGRRYTVIYAATDSHGNESSAEALVSVPGSMGASPPSAAPVAGKDKPGTLPK